MMRVLKRLALVAMVVVAGCGKEETGGAGRGAASDTAAVREAFEQYRRALRTLDANAAVAALDSGTIAYYGRMRDLALEGSERTVRSLPTLEQVLVMALRHRVPLDTLRGLTPAGVVGYTLRPEFMGETAMQQDLQLGRIEIEGDEATAEASVVGESTGQGFRFKRENDVWKVNIAGIPEEISQRVDAMIGSADERERIMTAMLERATGKPMSPELWIPPAESGPAAPDSTRR